MAPNNKHDSSHGENHVQYGIERWTINIQDVTGTNHPLSSPLHVYLGTYDEIFIIRGVSNFDKLAYTETASLDARPPCTSSGGAMRPLIDPWTCLNRQHSLFTTAIFEGFWSCTYEF